MPTVHLLGTGAVRSDPDRTTTMLAATNDEGTLLIDCGGDVAPRLEAVGIDPTRLEALIVTHEHADHVAGLPLLMERLWLMGRRTPLPVYGIAPAIAQVHRVHDAFDVEAWEGYPGLEVHEVAQHPGAEVLHRAGWRVTAAPGTHAVPSVGLRLEDEASGRVLGYSGDTAPDPRIAELVRGADLLLHEATGEGPVHTGAAEAAGIARDANVGRLILVHVPPRDVRADDVAAARAAFPGTTVGDELQGVPF